MPLFAKIVILKKKFIIIKFIQNFEYHFEIGLLLV